jgi:hypothetical protein
MEAEQYALDARVRRDDGVATAADVKPPDTLANAIVGFCKRFLTMKHSIHTPV